MKGVAAREARSAEASPAEVTLAVAVGNTSIFVGLFAAKRRAKVFRLQPGELVRLPRRVGGRVDRAAVCSVVPGLTPDVLRVIRRTWSVEASVLTAEAEHGLKVGYRRPKELGADRVAAAVGARSLRPSENVIVVDCGTATTVTAVTRSGTIAGGAILPGAALWPEALAVKTALLPRVTLRRAAVAVGRTPQEAIVSGCYFGQVGAIREVVARVRREAFGSAKAVVLGTGGNVRLFANERLFDEVQPALVLVGLAEFATNLRTGQR